jgi:beta-lactamase regulating signal transducer with metallopeptidase domain
MVEHLDQRELEAVLAHELGHVVRRDYLVIWLATLLRDAFCYLPTSWLAYRQLQHEKELACDELAVNVTNRPLALASALTKTWQYALGQRSPGLAQSLTGRSQLMETRIERLLLASTPLTGALSSRLLMLSFSLGTLSILVLAAAVISAVVLAPMDCGPVSILLKLFS